jgi:hypothetical protein
MTEYDPEYNEHRKLLASTIIDKMKECGFSEEHREGTKEKVYSRKVGDTGMSVVVYTTIVGNHVRVKDSDAIRICGVYRNEEKDIARGICKDKRVYRTGDIAGIVSRMHERMRNAYRNCNSASRCHCGTPKFISKKGNVVCAEVCWKN